MTRYKDRPQPGWEMISPGFYVDPVEETLHFFPDQALRFFGYKDTPANRETLYRAMQDVVREKFGRDIPISLVSPDGTEKKL